MNNANAAYLGPSHAGDAHKRWQWFKIIGRLVSGQTSLWIVVRQFPSNGDD